MSASHVWPPVLFFCAQLYKYAFSAHTLTYPMDRLGPGPKPWRFAYCTSFASRVLKRRTSPFLPFFVNSPRYLKFFLLMLTVEQYL